MIFLLLACVEKRILPEPLRDSLVYDVDIIAKFDSEASKKTIAQDWKILVEKIDVNRDDSLNLRLEFVEARWKIDQGDWQDSTLAGEELLVQAFPWGEMLRVTGWEELPKQEELDAFDIVLPLLFPNPPVREGQQWKYRVLPWRYHYPIPEGFRYLNQKLIANWSKPEETLWEYQGEWVAKTRMDDIFLGEAKGKIWSSGTWIERHEWDWQREIEFPISKKEHFSGTIQQVKKEEQ